VGVKILASFEKALFWEKPIQKISRRIAKALPFMSDTSVTQNLAKKMNTTEEGTHMAMIGFVTFLSPGLFKVLWTPFAIAEMIKAYKKDRFRGVVEAGKWYLMSAAAGVTAKEGTASAVKAIKGIIKGC